MSEQKKQWGAIIIMIALFAMIAFVTNLCSPMAVIVKNDFGASNVLSQIGNYGNFIAYLVMGIPAGMLIAKFGYKKTALIGLFVGIIGILVQWLSGHVGKESAFLVYLIGAFITGFTMCILNLSLIHIWLGGFEGTNGATFPARSAICFEAQCFPDTPNKAHFPSATLLPGDEYQQVTIYKFGVEK